MSYVHCQNCGRGNADIARICRYCGAQLKAGGARRPAHAEPPPVSYVPPHSWKSGSLPPQPSPLAQAQPQLSAEHFRCPYCQTAAPPTVGRRIGTAGWVVFFALLIFCFPLCFVGLFIKEEYRQCSWCRAALS